MDGTGIALRGKAFATARGFGGALGGGKTKRLVFALCLLAGTAAAFANETKIKILVGGTELEGVFYGTELAEEILQELPLTVSMVAYGGREYYGALPFAPKAAAGGQLCFSDGDITYCAANNTLAIFYAQTDRPNLTMEVVPIGRVTSGLSVFASFNGREKITFALEK